MSSRTVRDSNFDFSMVPIERDGYGASFQNDDDSSGMLQRSAEIPVFDLLSNDPLPDLSDDLYIVASARVRAPVDPSSSGSRGGVRDNAAGPADELEDEFWFEGNALMCPCPDCRAPMSVRVWLMLADCWNCGTIIELTLQQERRVRQLIENRERRGREQAARPAAIPGTSESEAGAASHKAHPRRSADAPTDQPQAESVPGELRGRSRSQPLPPAAPLPPRQRVPATGAAIGPRARIRRMATAGSPSIWLSDALKMTPAWLISALLHFVALLLLALFTMPKDQEDAIRITLSTKVSAIHRENDLKIEKQKDQLQFNLKPPEDVNLESEKVKQVWLRADQDARELQIDPDTPDPNLPPLEKLKERIQTDTGPRRFVLARDPRIRVEMVEKEGGTSLTEAAVARGLRWIAKQQNHDGSWRLEGYDRGLGQSNDTAATALALLPFFGAGQTHMTGRYKEVVARGLRWLVDHQGDDGYLRDAKGRAPKMYAHGQGAIVLCEAYAMEGNKELRDAAQKAIDFIVDAQHIHGGWRYEPGQTGDTSVVGWQLMALQSARAAGLDVPEETMTLANQFLDQVWARDGYRYGYQGPTSNVSETMTAEAILCRMFLGWNRESPGVTAGIDWLVDNHMPNQRTKNMYYWYYATQTMHHVGGDQWRIWNNKMRDVLVDLQETKGDLAGSWSASGFRWGAAGGRLYVTSLAVCTLEVYYRHLPIFKQIDLD